MTVLEHIRRFIGRPTVSALPEPTPRVVAPLFRYRPISQLELAGVAKTGCRKCYGSGFYGARAGQVTVCRCVLKGVAGDAGYAVDEATGALMIRFEAKADKVARA